MLPLEKLERPNPDLFVQDTRSLKTIAEESERVEIEPDDSLDQDALVNMSVDFEADFSQGT